MGSGICFSESRRAKASAKNPATLMLPIMAMSALCIRAGSPLRRACSSARMQYCSAESAMNVRYARPTSK